ncbi:MAG: MATE family efflux transporter [Oscillospiraceae bacterium]|nr:MATE family efflux transporter [Oscillospiraceae bacterium]
MNDAFMREKPVTSLVLSMSLPMVLSMLVNALYNIVDSYFVAMLSEDALTALSLAYPMQNLVNAVAIGFGIGVNAAIAFYLGAGQQTQANRAATLGLVLSILHGILLTVFCIGVMPAFLGLFSADGAVLSGALRYSRIVFSFSTIICLALFFEKTFQAVGRMVVSMAALLVGCVSNILLDPLLIFGLGPFPALGIEGAALATGLGQLLNLAVYGVVYVLRPIPVRLRLRLLWSSSSEEPTVLGPLLQKLYAVGIPATLNQALPSLLVSALNGILAGFSQSYVLVLGVYYKLQTFLYLTANGIVQGIRPLVSYNHGAGEHGRIRQIFRTALGMSALIMAFGTVICLAIPGPLFGLFTDNSTTIAYAETALRIISIGFLPSAISVTASGALEGLGRGLPSLVISLLRYLLLIVPLAFVLSRFLSAVGVWLAFCLTEWIAAAVSLCLWRREQRETKSI